MDKTTDIHRAIKELGADKKTVRERKSLYLSKELYEKFSKACDGAPPSRVIEKLMLMVVEEKIPA